MAHQPTSHTPGPWLTTSSERTDQISVHLEDGSHLALVGDHPEGSPEQVLANARLIAAAPDLLEACMTLAEAASESVELGDWPELMKAIEQADAAIAKANGTQPDHE